MTKAELIAALEAAPGPSRELDGEIAKLRGWVPAKGGWTLPDGSFIGAAPPFTESIDAALTLVPEGHEWSVGLAAGIGRACVWLPNPLRSVSMPKPVKANTPALAFCIAALKAQEPTP